MTTKNKQSLLDSLDQMSATELRRVLAEHLTQQKLGLYWERNAIDHDKALNANVVLPRLVSYTFGLPTPANAVLPAHSDDAVLPLPGMVDSTHASPSPWSVDLFGDATFVLDTLAQDEASKKPKRQGRPRTRQDVAAVLDENRLRTYARKTGLVTLSDRLKSEEKPSMVDLSAISHAVASRLALSETLQKTAVLAALNRIEQKEKHKELTEGHAYELNIQVVTDRAALARDAMATLADLPHAEEEDYRIIVQVLSERLRPVLEQALAGTPEEALSEADRLKYARDAAHWVIRDSGQELTEAIFEGIADQAIQVEAKPLPDMMIFPQDIPLDASAKNIYGVFPSSTENAQEVESVLFMDERQWWVDQSFELDDGHTFTVGRYDGVVKINQLEREFAQALDEADFVHWWHRNPDKKPYAVRVVRSEHDHYFYPDFVVCVAHESDDPPMQRLLETKESTKDAARKAKHFPAAYGKVLFLTPDGNRLRWVNDDGSLGDAVKLTEMGAVHDRLKATKPVAGLAMSK